MDRILIVDDNPKNIQLLATILADNNYDIEYALNGKDALDILKTESFDLILLDIMMPEMDGFETAGRIKLLDKKPEIPLIFLTAKTDTESITKAFNMGAIDYLSKPFNVDELLIRIGTHIALKNSKYELSELNRKLEDKVRERTQELAASNEALKKANEELAVLDHSKNEFLRLINHEIRTPLNGIVGFTHIIKEFVKDEMVVESIDALDLSCKRLEEFSYLALDISRINTQGTKALCFVTYEFSMLVNNVLSSLKEVDVNEKDLSVELNLEKAEAKLDIKYLSKCIQIIISNAISHSLSQGKITVSGKQDNHCYTLKIKDEGSGFPEILLRNGIKSFISQHVDSNPGIELYFCRLVVEAHGGSLTIKNQDGAVVELSIPVNS